MHAVALGEVGSGSDADPPLDIGAALALLEAAAPGVSLARSWLATVLGWAR